MSDPVIPGTITVVRYASAGDCCEVIVDWFKGCQKLVMESADPCLVLVPEFSVSLWIRRTLLEAGYSSLGMRFITPSDARILLSRHFGFPSQSAGNAEIDLFASSAALSKNDLKSRALAAESSSLRSLLEILAPTGRDFSALLSQYGLKSVYDNFQDILHEYHLMPSWEVDRKSLEHSSGGNRWISSLMIFGFNGGHWSLRHLLQALMQGSTRNLLFLEEPREEQLGGKLDRTWIDTWEEFAGKDSIFASAAGSEPVLDKIFLIGHDTQGQAEAVVSTVSKWLEEGASRIGVLVPRSGALSDEISRRFSSSEFSFYDGVASLSPDMATTPEWRAWLELQTHPAISTIVKFLKTLQKDTRKWERLFDKAWSATLSDDPEIIRQWFVQQGEPVEIFPKLLPDSATILEMRQRTNDIFLALGWQNRATHLQSAVMIFGADSKRIVARIAWCRWLQQTLEKFTRSREKLATEPYARVHLLSYESALSQQWSHLVFAGMNDSGDLESEVALPFLDGEEAALLNSEIRRQNRKAIQEGAHGMGAEVLQSGYALCIGSEEKQQIGQRTLYSLLDSVTSGYCFTASLHSEAKPSLLLRPSNFFADQWSEARGTVLSDEKFRLLAEGTHRDLQGIFPALPFQKNEAIAAARFVRTNENKNFGRYEFAFEKAPVKAAFLACDAWEKAYKDPAPAWLRYYLGVQLDSDFHDVSWNTVIGMWTHRWLDAIHLRETLWESFPAADIRNQRISSAAWDFRERISRAYSKAGKTIPFWWEAAFQRSLDFAYRLSGKLDAISPTWKFAAEYAVSDSVPVSVAEGLTLHLRGRMDLVMVDGMESPENAIVADYKTGRSKPLDLTSLKKGDGIQVALYAILMKALGWQNVNPAYVVAEHPFSPGQLPTVFMEETISIWQSLVFMQETGRFGMRGDMDGEYTHTMPLPMATLRIEPEILNAKWKLSHGNLKDE